jgi:Uma2 family endonuclease
MDANRTRARWTWAEFARLPSEGSRRYEIIADELYVTPGPAPRHQRVVTHLIRHLDPFVRDHGLGEVFPGPIDILFGEGDYLEPDLVFVGSARAHLVTDRGIEGAPDLVVEIASPSTAARDRELKRDRYRLFGVPEYWVIDPEAASVEVWRFAEAPDAYARLADRDHLHWRPVARGPSLAIEVAELVADR